MPDVFVSQSKNKEEKKHSSHPSSSPTPTSIKKGSEAVKSTETESQKHLHKQPFEKVREELGLNEPLYQKRPLSAFVFQPDGIAFETMESEEKVVLFLRQHPIVNVPWILLALLMVFAPFVVSSFSLFDEVPANFTFIFMLIWYLITTAFVLEKFLTWFFNVYIVTDERVIDIDFYNLIYKEVSDANIDKIQDVTYNMGGVIRTIFNYGNVLIQTASEVPNFEFVAVPKPDKVARILQTLRIEEQQEAIEGRVR